MAMQGKMTVNSLAARVARLEEKLKAMEAEAPKTAPPPAGRLYGEPISERLTTLFKLEADAACMARAEAGKLRQELADAQAHKKAANARGDMYMDKYLVATAELSQLRARLPKPGAVIALPQRPAPFTMGEMFCLLTGLGLGAIAGGMLL